MKNILLLQTKLQSQKDAEEAAKLALAHEKKRGIGSTLRFKISGGHHDKHKKGILNY